MQSGGTLGRLPGRAGPRSPHACPCCSWADTAVRATDTQRWRRETVEETTMNIDRRTPCPETLVRYLHGFWGALPEHAAAAQEEAEELWGRILDELWETE